MNVLHFAIEKRRRLLLPWKNRLRTPLLWALWFARRRRRSTKLSICNYSISLKRGHRRRRVNATLKGGFPPYLTNSQVSNYGELVLRADSQTRGFGIGGHGLQRPRQGQAHPLADRVFQKSLQDIEGLCRRRSRKPTEFWCRAGDLNFFM